MYIQRQNRAHTALLAKLDSISSLDDLYEQCLDDCNVIHGVEQVMSETDYTRVPELPHRLYDAIYPYNVLLHF